jgi:DHA1 family multidrug resistance protein-like MFS transporter
VTLPFLPYYVQELGVTDLEQVAFWAGLLTSAQSTTMALVGPLWGSLADRYGRKIMVERAMFGGAVIICLMGFSRNVYQLAILRAIQGTLTGTVSAATTLVAGGTPRERRGFALGLLQMSTYLGHSVGPLIGGLIADSMGYRMTFWVTSGMLIVAGVLVATLVREKHPSLQETAGDAPPEERHPSQSRPRSRLWDGLLMVLRTRALLILFGVRVLMRVAVRIIGPVMPLFVQQIAPPGTKIASLSGTISGVASATGAVGAIAMGRIGDKVGYRRILFVCGTAACVLYAVMSQARTPMQFLILRALVGMTMGGILSSVSALLASFTPEGRYGAVYGLNTSVVAGAGAIAPMIGAGLTAAWGLPSAFIGAAVMYGIATVVAVITVPTPRVQPRTGRTESSRAA